MTCRGNRRTWRDMFFHSELLRKRMTRKSKCIHTTRPGTRRESFDNSDQSLSTIVKEKIGNETTIQFEHLGFLRFLKCYN
mmetsp:Transcript_9839/g.17888  ORF Transcript_9839/g.17888 Transcript_9839/m.17888 type:complete len:80 (-) Transcript_9839:2271-2510(-)